ncbi:unnamed protein product [Orchesella dallaii]|uniref:CHK kinase-like domain-containing protein n=1 Tax=Orchesella dallaii TaxID=48710 RepID=A0ABP1PPJ1_9HEXA
MGREDVNKPDNIIWVEGVILNNLEENGGIEAISKSESRSHVDNHSNQKSQSQQSITSTEELKISVGEIELKDESFLGDERIKPMSRIVSGKIKYFIGNREDNDEKFQYWIIKMPTFIQPNRSLLKMTNAGKREIAFYTQILPDIKSLIDNEFISFQKLVRESSHPKAREIQYKMSKLRPHLLNKLYNILIPAEPPLPNTLVHMDFWSENILFRMKEEDKETEVPVQEADLDCCIIDWQMVSYGRPTHDLALLLMLSLEPEDRRENGKQLLQYYFELFRKTAEYFDLTLPFDYEMIQKEFTNSCVLAALMAMASIEVVTMEESTQNRFFEALADLIDDNLL